tara:strand:+ start:487 stop:660 length:174 start_codon:yes stop_codon:yes gene_type:complete
MFRLIIDTYFGISPTLNIIRVIVGLGKEIIKDIVPVLKGVFTLTVWICIANVVEAFI